MYTYNHVILNLYTYQHPAEEVVGRGVPGDPKGHKMAAELPMGQESVVSAGCEEGSMDVPREGPLCHC